MEGKNFLPVWDYRTFLVYDVDSMNEVLIDSANSK